MANPIVVEDLTPAERLDLIERLWASLEAEVKAPLTPALAAELDRREAESDANPEEGESWPRIRDELRKRLG